ncbi:MAG: cbb3-type cytochrome c oxidase subunit 3 [Deltaproteobacteria bacterium]|nr:cbb3-type cytochrome c oxidase subunit 3 [Deltaproteobacteria bacterium]
MNLESISSLGTVVLMSAFVALCFWAYSPRRRRQFDEAARLALDDDKTAERTLCPPIASHGPPAVETAGYSKPSLLEAGSPPQPFVGVGGESPSGDLAASSRRIHSPGGKQWAGKDRRAEGGQLP